MDEIWECDRCVCSPTPGTVRPRENGQTLCDACEEHRLAAIEMRAAQATPKARNDDGETDD